MSAVRPFAPVRLASKKWTSKAAQEIGWHSTLTIMHGLLGNKNNWSSLCQKLSSHPQLEEVLHTCYSLDLRNHGESPHTGSHTVDDLADDLDHFLDTTVRSQGYGVGGLETPSVDVEELVREKAMSGGGGGDLPASVVCAHSMGGLALMHSLVRAAQQDLTSTSDESSTSSSSPLVWGTHQEYLDLKAQQRAKVPIARAAVVVDINPTPRPSSSRGSELARYLAALNAMPLEEVKDSKSADLFLRDHVPSDSLRAFMLTNLRFQPKKDGGAAFWQCNMPLLQQSLSALSFPHEPDHFSSSAAVSNLGANAKKKSDVPILFVYGQQSEYNNHEGQAYIDAYFSNVVDRVVIPDAGHFVHHEQKDLFIDAIAPFLRDQMLMS